MSAIVDPYTYPKNWGTITMTGYGVLPGVLVGLKGLKREHEWAVQKGIAMSGASTIWRGQKIIEDIGIILEGPDVDAFKGFDKLLAALVPKKPTQKPATFSFVHPMFELVGVARCSLKSYGVEPSPGNSWQLGIGLIEYRPLVLAKVGPADPAKLPGPPKPVTENQKQIADLMAQIQKEGAP